jgi:hypothetical protein
LLMILPVVRSRRPEPPRSIWFSWIPVLGRSCGYLRCSAG